MEMNLQSLATTCFVSGQPFVEGVPVASYLVRSASLEIIRYDLIADQTKDFAPPGFVACSWVRPYKYRPREANADRTLKLNAETLFLALADPATEPTPENTRLVQFLAFMLERKRIVKPKGKTADGERNIFEHTKTKQLFEVAAGELTPEFFIQVQAQLSVLVGEPKPKATTPAATVPEPAAVAAVPPAG